MGPNEPLTLIADPRRPRARLPIGQCEDHVAEQLSPSAQRTLGRLGRQAADEQQLTTGSSIHLARHITGSLAICPATVESVIPNDWPPPDQPSSANNSTNRCK
jgi:hypothetical protein